MKKTFRSILAGALALMMVSCYDDSALREDIKGLDDRVTAIEAALNAEVNGLNDLASRLADAEDALAAANVSLTAAQGSISEILAALDAFDGQVDGLVSQFEKAITDLGKADSELSQAIAAGDNALAAALQEGKTQLAQELAAVLAKVAVVKVEEVGGNVVLTLADGNKVSLSKPLSNVENSGLVTVDENGMWAVVKADGTTESLNVPVGHPDVKIQFQVAEDGTLQYSVNGGAWAATGVSTSDLSGQSYVINNVQVAEDNSHVTITIGETAFALPLYVAKTVTFELSRESMYVGYGLTKTFTVVSEGVESFYVASKPDGWKVTVEGNVVTVAAPSQKLVDLGACELDGQVVLHADAESCKYASLDVVTGPAFSITIDNATGDITIFNALAVEYPDMTGMYGPSYDFGDALIGILPVSDFEFFTSVDELIEASESWTIPSGYLANIKGNNDLGGYYEAGVYEEDKIVMNIADLGATFYPKVTIEEGVQYVVWAVPQTDKVLKDLYTVAMYKPLKVETEKVSATYKDIEVKLNAYGATGYYVSVYDASMFEYMPLKDFLETGYMGVGPWVQFVQAGDPYALGMPVEAGETFSLSDMLYGEPLSPNSEYVVIVFPYDASKPSSEYVYEEDLEPYIYTFKTENIFAGAPEAVLTLDEEGTSYTGIKVNVQAPTGATVYYSFVEPGELDEMEPAEAALYVMSSCYYPIVGEGVASVSYLQPTVAKPSISKQLYAVAVTEEGAYSLVVESFESLKLPIDDAATVTVESMTKDAENNVTVVLNVTGATRVVGLPSYNGAVQSAFLTNIMSYGVKMNYSSYAWAEVVDGKATLTYQSSNGYLVFSAYNVYETSVTDFTTPVSVAVANN